MKTSQGGYKAMIRDRCPKTADLALKWCKCKTEWVDHVYYHYVWFLQQRDQRDSQVRALLGISKYCRNFEFRKTIDWDNLDCDEIKYWDNICKWVEWFEKYWKGIESKVSIYRTTLEPDEKTADVLRKLVLVNWEPEQREKFIKFIFDNVLCIFQSLISTTRCNRISKTAQDGTCESNINT